MGQKVHPNGYRVGIHKGWQSNWIVQKKEVAPLIEEDNRLRRFLTKELEGAGVSKLEISRKVDQVTIDIYTARPGVVVGKGGQGIETLAGKIRAMLSRKGLEVKINILEINRVDLESKLVAQSIAQQLEKRVAFRRAMKQAMQRCMRAGAIGIKVMVAGRLGGAEIARTEWAKEGRIPLQTLRADIDYGVASASTLMGVIGVKVWIFRGELEPGQWSPPNIKLQTDRDRQNMDRPERAPQIWQEIQKGRLVEMLMPKRTKYRKHHRGRMTGCETRGVKVDFGEYGLQVLEPAWITSRQIEAARKAMTRSVKRGGQIWIRVFPDKAVSKKPAEVRMGSGKGNPEFWVAVVKTGRVMFEMAGVNEKDAHEALALAAQKLPVKCRVVKRQLGS